MASDKGFEAFLEALGVRESSGRYDNDKNPYYHGKYQMGLDALHEAKYYDKNKGVFLGKNGIDSVKDFLNNPAAQEDAIRRFTNSQWKQVQSNCGYLYKGQTINGVKLTDSGVIAGAHLVGAGGVCTYIKTNGKTIPRDKYGTTVEEYIRKFAGYDVSEVTTDYKERDFYKEFLYKNSMTTNADDTSKNKPAKLTSGMLQNQLASQNDAKMNFLQRIYMESEGIQKRFNGSVPEGYKNPHLENDKIFTKEEIDKMTWAETKKNQQAINYQKKVMGVPTKQQAEKAAEKKGSGLVHVSGYTTSDGRKVADYYRALPRK